MFLGILASVWGVFCHYCLSVSPAVTRLTVYRRLQVRILFQLVGLPGDYRPIGEFEVVFLKNVNFSRTNLIFWEKVLLEIVNARVHARGFARL